MKKLFGLTVLLLFQGIIIAQTSNKTSENSIQTKCKLEGIVKDASTGEVLIGATIYLLEDQRLVTISDDLGHYSLIVPTGTYTIICSYITFEELHIPKVFFEKGKNKLINFQLSKSAISINQVIVTGRANAENELVALTQQKKATVMESSMGASELSRKGASDVAAGVKKMSGISMIGNSQIFVRGLGDRYNQVQLNGMLIPSPDPTKKVINLNLFPSDVVKSIGVTKVYSSTNFGDYSGALINIETKDYPDKKYVAISAGIGYNNQTTGKNFLKPNSISNNIDKLNIFERNKILPDAYKIVNRNQNTQGLGTDIFKSNMGYENSKANPDFSINLSGGNTFKFKKSKLGLLFSSSFDNESVFEENTYYADFKADGTVKNQFYKDAYTYSSRFTNLVTITHVLPKGLSIKGNLFYTSGSNEILEQKHGESNESDSIFVYTSEFINNSIIYSQLIGKKSISNTIDIEWKAGYSSAKSLNPDKRQATYIYDNITKNWYIYTLNQQESLRAFIDQNEKMYTSDIFTKYKSEKTKTQITFGAHFSQKTKDYNSYIYYYNLKELNNIPTEPTNPLLTFSNENFENNLIYLKNGNSYPMMYEGQSTIIAAYSDAVYNGINKIVINAGLRYEFSNLNVDGYNQAGIKQSNLLTTHDFLPALNTKYTISENSNIRFAASRTITRPTFYEKSPATIIPEFGEPKTQGNKDLLNAYNTNIDLKFESYPNQGEIFSIGIYGKALSNPIEMIAKPTGGTILYTFKNTKNGYAGGIELEFKKYIKEKIFFGCNASYIYTFIEVPQNANETEKQRKMQGASPYLINGDLGYQISYGENKKYNSSAAIVYNVYGKRLFAVGTDGMGSIFELPYNTLDLIIKNKISSNWNANLNIRNILNQKTEFVQGVSYNESSKKYERFEKLREYKKGVSVSISISYSIL